MNDMTTTILVAVLGSQAFLEVVKALIKLISKPSAMQSGIKWMLENDLKEIATAEIKAGFTTPKTHKFINDGYKIYHDLQGNGEMTKLMSDYEKLEVRY